MKEKCNCNKEYVSWKLADLPYDTETDTHYTDILIWYCPICGHIDRIEEY
jgi:hypothetical protein